MKVRMMKQLKQWSPVLVLLCFLLGVQMMTGCNKSSNEQGTAQAQTAPKTEEVAKPPEGEKPKPPEEAQANPEKKPPQDEAPSKTYRLDEPHPTIAFAESSFDFGDSQQDQDVKHTFKFKNSGQRELEIVSVKGG